MIIRLGEYRIQFDDETTIPSKNKLKQIIEVMREEAPEYFSEGIPQIAANHENEWNCYHHADSSKTLYTTFFFSGNPCAVVSWCPTCNIILSESFQRKSSNK